MHLLKDILKIFIGNKIIFKSYKNYPVKIYYEKAQHLMFLLKRTIVYEPIIQEKSKNYIHESDIVFDIGANIGQYALIFSKLVGDDGKVISIEPDYKNYSFLQFNININNLKNVVCLKSGISDTTGFIKFYRDTQTGGRMGSFDQRYVMKNFRGFTDEVATRTFDSMIDEYGEPNFVKIDVEGFEVQVMEGLTYALNKTVFIVEVRKETKESIFNYFSTRNYKCYIIDNKVDVLVSTCKQIPEFANLLFKK
jgi:FkbM family methyltransferase